MFLLKKNPSWPLFSHAWYPLPSYFLFYKSLGKVELCPIHRFYYLLPLKFCTVNPLFTDIIKNTSHIDINLISWYWLGMVQVRASYQLTCQFSMLRKIPFFLKRKRSYRNLPKLPSIIPIYRAWSWLVTINTSNFCYYYCKRIALYNLYTRGFIVNRHLTFNTCNY